MATFVDVRGSRGARVLLGNGDGNFSTSTVVVGNGNHVVGTPTPGRAVVVAGGGVVVAIRVGRGLRRRVESWAKRQHLGLADAVVELARRGLDAEEGA